MKSLLLLSTLLASTALCAIVNSTTAVEIPDVLPAAKSGFTIEFKDAQGPTMQAVLDDYQRVTGIHLVTTTEVRNALAKLPTGLSQSLDVQAPQVHTIVEHLLLQAGYCTILLNAADPVLVGVVPAIGQMAMGSARYVAPSDVASVAQHPGLMFWTVGQFDHIDINETANAMRFQWKARDFETLLPMANSRGILLIGAGADVAARIGILQKLDETNARVERSSPKDSTSTSNAGSSGSAPVKK